jgi:predicted small lipoprotein YifL
MKKKLIAIYFVLTALITLAGCGGAAKYPNYYTLYVPAAAGSASAEGLSAHPWPYANSDRPLTCIKAPSSTKHLQNKSVSMITINGRSIRESS